MKLIRITAALALVAGASFMASTAVYGQEDETETPTADSTGSPTTGDNMTMTPTTGDDGTETPGAGGDTQDMTSTPVAGGAQDLPSTGTGDSGRNASGVALLMTLIGITFVAGAGAFAFGNRNR